MPPKEKDNAGASGASDLGLMRAGQEYTLHGIWYVSVYELIGVIGLLLRFGL
jgi:hypothetical protein